MVIKYTNELTQRLEFPGLAELKLKHKVESTDADFTYAGPRIDKESWHQVMSFFRWTYKEAKSESQVRGFIDPVDQKIIFWAFPQEAGTGMTTREIPGEDFDKQRLALPHSSDLIYFITNHHHCGCSAFQSGGDSANEERPGGGAHETGQDGLHITMGKMDEGKHDMDVRFYLKKAKLVPNMAMFWDIGKEIADLIPATMHQSIALFQMCQKIEVPFPEQWKENYRRPAPSVTKTSASTIYRYDGGMGYGCVGGHGNGDGIVYHNRTLFERIKESAEELVDDLMRTTTMEVQQFKDVITFLRESVVMDEVLSEAMKERYDAMDLRTLFKEMDEAISGWEDSTTGEPGTTPDGKVDTDVNKRKSKKQRKREAKAAAAEAANVAVLPAVTGEPRHGEQNESHTAHWDADRHGWVPYTTLGD